MKLVLTNKEIVALGEYALKCHHVSGALLVQAEQVICTETLVMTDKELLDEMTTKAITSIRAIGGEVVYTNNGEYIVNIPEEFVLDQFDKSNKVTVAVMPLMLKAYNFGKKYFTLALEMIERFKRFTLFAPSTTMQIMQDIEDLKIELAKAEQQVEKLIKG